MEVIETATGRPVLALGSTKDWASHADSNPQGDLMAISGPGHGFSLWNTRTWKKVRDFGTNVPKASSIRFSPDGRLLLTTGATNRLDLWDAATGDHLRTVRDSGVALFYATFSTSGDRIIASRGGRGWIWDTQTGALLTEVPTTPSTPDFLEITSDARHLVTIETNGVAAAWKVGATQPFFQTPPEDGGIGWAGLNLSERRFATHRADSSQLKFWNLDTGIPLPDSQVRVREVALTEDGQSLLTAAGDQRIRRWSWETGAPETDWGTGMSFAYSQMSPSRNGRFIAVLMPHLQSPPSLRLWALPPADRRIAPSSPINRAALSPDGRTVAAGHFADQLSLWDADTGRRTAYLIGHHRTVSSVAWTADSKTLFSASADHTIRRWNVAERRCELVLTNLDGPIWSVSISTNADVVAAADFTGAVGLWQGDGTLIQLLKLGRSLAVPSAIVSPDGRWLVVLGFPSGQGVWEIFPTRQVLPFNTGPSAFEDLPLAAAFSPDGLRLATIAPSGQLILWDTRTWKPIQTIPTRSGATDLIFSPDGLRLFLAASQAALAIGDTSVAVHDGLTGERLVSFDKVPGWTSSLGLDRDGRRLLRSVQDVAPRGHGVDVWDTFPWRNQDYPGNPDESLGSRILQFARNQERSRQQRLETADAGLPETWPPEPRSHWRPRDAATPDECVDLTAAYNGHLETGWFPEQQFDLHDNNFAQLPQGIVQLVGIPWDIRGVISTGRTESTPYLRWRSGRVVEGIPVERRCRRLHFLHAASSTPLTPSRVGKYRLHYGDGSSADLELELGMDIGEYSSNNSHHPLSRCDRGEIAWEGSNPIVAQRGYGIRLFHRAWDNPHPDKKIVSMDLVADGPSVLPFLVALTVEP